MSLIEYLAPGPRWPIFGSRRSYVGAGSLHRAREYLKDNPAKCPGDLTGAAVRFAADLYAGHKLDDMLGMVHNAAWQERNERKFGLEDEEWSEGLALAVSWEVQKIERGRVKR